MTRGSGGGVMAFNTEQRAAYNRRLRRAARPVPGEPIDPDLYDKAIAFVAQETAARRARRDKTRAPKPDKRRAAPEFVALDGEGVTRPDGQHDYTLIGCSDGRTLEAWRRDGLATVDCLEFLLDTQAQHPRAKLVGFAFGYDSNMIFRDLTERQIIDLAEGGYVTFRARGQHYRIKYIPAKSLYLSRGHWTKRDGFKVDLSTTIYDVFGFFQASFVRALREWKVGGDPLVERIEAMKARRGSFVHESRAEIIAYCLEECEALVDLMGELAAVLDAADIRPTLWNGAGAVASALLKREGIKDHIARPDQEELEHAIMCAYFGGRVERFVGGIIPDTIYDYDLNSAYPAEIAKLPTMIGEWRRIGDYRPGEPYALWRVTWRTARRPRPGPWMLTPFPVRNRRAIYWPKSGSGWYHAAEVRAALESPDVEIFIDGGWVFRPDDHDARPFAWIDDLYQQRKVYKTAGDARHIVLKLGLNSLYGKLAQGVSGGRGRPAYQSYYWAGMVTAGTRAAMQSAARGADPLSLVAIATDGLFVREALPLPLTDELGGWSVTEIEPGMIVAQAGFMCSPGGAVFKTRGMAREGIKYETLAEAWRRDGFMAKIPVTEERFIGLAYAAAMGRFDLWRRWEKQQRSIGFAPTPRKWPETRAWTNAREFEYVLPPEGFGEASEPYVPKDADSWKDDTEDGEALRQLRYLYEQPDIDTA